ncbi:MAG: hypothetical protein QGG36_04710 [Pirellulaceae bacterium]|jgi:hypothetical protein|nr:hypothetical protein [Pirellulaceae bacterium]
MQKIGALLDCHAGEPAWIFGKGPSLDAFPMNSAGPLRLCINESVRAVPSPTYFFAHDEGPIKNVADAWPAKCRAILQPVRAEYAKDCGIPEKLLYTYEKRFADNAVRDLDAEGIAKRSALYGNTGTVHCAIHFCRLIGVSRVVMVGFDGSGGYAKAIGLPDGGAAHERIKSDSKSLLTALEFPFNFFGD